MAKESLSLLDSSIEDKIRCSITPDDNILINIPKSIKYNHIVIARYEGRASVQEEQIDTEPKDARLLGIAKVYHQYMSRSWSFPYYDTDSDRYARENKDSGIFKRTAKICRDIFNAKLGISPCVFSGITAIPIKKGYENSVIDGIGSVINTFHKIKSGKVSLLEFRNGDAVFEFCLYLAKRTAGSRSNADRAISARLACAFWNAYLEDGKLENLHRIASSFAFVPLNCCPVSKLPSKTA